MPLFSPGAILGAQASGYKVSNSLRFRSSASAYLSRTPGSAGSRTTWTWSAWVKRGALGAYQSLFSADTTTGAGATSTYVWMTNGDVLQFTFEAGTYYVSTSAVFRDPSAWYHIVAVADTTNATAANRMKLYVNGVLQSLSASAYPAQNYQGQINNTLLHSLGARVYPAPTIDRYTDGYLTEVNFIDGQALTPSDFGQTDTATGVWSPKKYTGTYGTNGFYLNFSDASAATAAAIGKDSSGNGNNWTPTNISVTAGVTYDSMVDTPTNYDNGGTGAGNYCVLNPLKALSQVALSSGNLGITITSSNVVFSQAFGTIGVSSGKYYFEFITASITGSGGGQFSVGVATASAVYNVNNFTSGNGWLYYGANGNKYNGSAIAYGATYGVNNVIGVAVDMDNGKIWFSKDNVWQASGDPVAGTNAAFTNLAGNTVVPFINDDQSQDVKVGNINFGQRPFTYTPPSGFKALCTQNLPTPTIGATSSTLANKYFDVSTWSGTGSSQSITNSGGFQPDLLWGKARNVASSHRLMDAVRGIGTTYYKSLYSDQTAAEAEDDVVTAFTSTGFNLAGVSNFPNATGQTYVGWQWKANGSGSSNTSGSITSTVSANVTAGFSVVTWTGTGATSATVGHGLSVLPNMVIIKKRNVVENWYVAHTGSGQGINFAYHLFLNTTGALSGSNDPYLLGSQISTTSNVLALADGTSNNGGNQSGTTYVAYCFAEVAGYSKFGSFTGNGSADGPMVWTGMRSRYIMIKRTDSTGNWVVYDTARNTYNAVTLDLDPNLSNAEAATGTNGLDILSNGFKIRDTSLFWNASGGTYIYAAFAETPFSYSRAR